MNTLNICLIVIVSATFVTGRDFSVNQVLPRTIWEEIGNEIHNVTKDAEGFIRCGMKAAIRTLEITIQNKIHIMEMMRNTEILTVSPVLNRIADKINVIEKVISQDVRGFLNPHANIPIQTFTTDSYDSKEVKKVMQELQLLEELVDILNKITIHTDKDAPLLTSTTPNYLLDDSHDYFI